LWFTGGGLIATWLAVNPNPVVPAGPSGAAAPRSPAVLQSTFDDLTLQETRLRQHLANVPLRPSGRNPFRFGASQSVRLSAAAPTVPVPAAAVVVPPSLSLSGIATDKGTRTAIIAGDGQLYLVKAGELVGGRYNVVSIDSDSVTLRDEGGIETRLALH
jgi:hypothetical protein